MQELSLSNTSHYLRKRFNDVTAIVALATFLAGILNIASALWAPHTLRLNVMYMLLPRGILSTSRTLTVLSGFFLVFLSVGLLYRKSRAWWLSMTLLVASIALHIVKGLDFDEVFLLLIPLAILLFFKDEFTAGSARQRLFKRVLVSLAILATLFIYSTAGFFALSGQFNQRVTWPKIYEDYQYSIFGVGGDTILPMTHRARWFEDSIATVGVAAFASILAVLFGPEILKNRPTEQDYTETERLVARFGQHPASFYALMDDKLYHFTRDKACVLAYKVRFGTAIALADPIGPKEQWRTCIESFNTANKKLGLSPVYYLASEETIEIHRSFGFRPLKVGSDAVLGLQDFTIDTPQLKNVRNSVNAVKRSGVSFSWYRMDELPWKIVRHIEQLRAEWQYEKHTAGMSFSMDFYPFPPTPLGEVLTAYNGSRLAAAFSFFPYRNGKGMVLDFMERSRHAPNGLVEAAVVEAVNHFKDTGKEGLDLGLSVAEDANRAEGKNLAEQGLDMLYKYSPAYNYLSLASFKRKFHPSWEPRYLVYPTGVELPKVAIALNQAMSK